MMSTPKRKSSHDGLSTNSHHFVDYHYYQSDPTLTTQNHFGFTVPESIGVLGQNF